MTGNFRNGPAALGFQQNQDDCLARPSAKGEIVQDTVPTEEAERAHG